MKKNILKQIRKDLNKTSETQNNKTKESKEKNNQIKNEEIETVRN